MVQSMTGFGKAKIETEHYTILVEIKTLNSKSADISLKLPRRFSEKELEIRNKAAQFLDRGKINIGVDFETKNKTEGERTQIDTKLATAYFKELKELASSLGTINEDTLFSQTLRMQGVVVETKEAEVSENELQNLSKSVEIALADCKKFRTDEGCVLHKTLKDYCLCIGSLLDKVVQQDPQRVEAVKNRIRSHVGDLEKSESFDHNRFEQEMIYYIEKLDISEEKVRLANHLDYFIHTMENEEMPGRKLGFIGQEIGREINTIGSKANDAIIQKLVVEMKDLLEKIKEQSLNVL
jgi:uncharacterized protein (TIGR00255 family)